jgi:1,4-dihydroxy-6-naphthoate synthase
MRQHIDLYVNNYSLSLGTEGRKAVDTLLQVFRQMQTVADLNGQPH